MSLEICAETLQFKHIRAGLKKHAACFLSRRKVQRSSLVVGAKARGTGGDSSGAPHCPFSPFFFQLHSAITPGEQGEIKINYEKSVAKKS